MTRIFVSLCLVLCASAAFAGGKEKSNMKTKAARKPNANARVLTGAPATQLFDLLAGNESDCGMGKCWSGGRVVCQRPTNPAEGLDTHCEISPLD